MVETRYVAIVDDHAMFRRGLSALINLFAHYKIRFEASGGKDFIRKVATEGVPDIVLLDITMPDMDGYATAEWIRKNYPQIKVLALSTMDSDSAIIKMIKHGAKGYILKDSEPEELKLAFDEVLSKGYFYNELVTRKVLGSINELVDAKSEVHLFVKLTDREVEFIRHTCSEMTYQEIADKMCLSERTIDGYRESVFQKLGVKTRVGLVLYAVKNNLVKL